MAPAPRDPLCTGRCYCGGMTVAAATLPQTAVWCHCTDCRRVTGAPAAAFAAFALSDVSILPEPGPGFSPVESVRRWFCGTCGSPLAATFAYLPDQIYIPLGILDQAADIAPELHCHAEAALPWMSFNDGLPRAPTSGRAALRDSGRSS